MFNKDKNNKQDKIEALKLQRSVVKEQRDTKGSEGLNLSAQIRILYEMVSEMIWGLDNLTYKKPNEIIEHKIKELEKQRELVKEFHDSLCTQYQELSDAIWDLM